MNIRREDWESLEPTVYGWGILDVNYEIRKRVTINGKRVQVWVCPYYEDWRQIITRCFSLKVHERQNTYTDCTVCEEWRYLSNFIKWVDSQPNRDWQNCELDKDFLVLGNKHYSPETVVYIPKNLNLFIVGRGVERSTLMLGVNPCNSPFNRKQRHVGVFPTELEAHLAWQAKKHEYACQLADLQDDPRVAKALRERYAPDKDWTNSGG